MSAVSIMPVLSKLLSVVYKVERLMFS